MRKTKLTRILAGILVIAMVAGTILSSLAVLIY